MKKSALRVALALALIFGSVAMIYGCGEDESGPECATSTDCPSGLLCDRGTCVTPGGPNNSNNPTDAGNNTSECPGAKEPALNDLILNEVLADPPAENGDANGDGVTDTGQDEFLEFYNNSGETLAIGGMQLLKNGDLKATIQTPCLEAGKAFVLFGGIQDGASPAAIPETVVEVSSKELGLNNGGADIVLQTAGGAPVVQASFPGASDESVTLSPQLTGTDYVGHTTLAAAAFSPGTCPDGKALATGCPGNAPDCTAPAATSAELILNEILTDPAADLAGDANQDGVRDSGADEFIELVNIGSARVKVGGFEIWREGDSSAKHVIATECLEPGQGLVVFGGLESGASLPVFGSTIVEISTSTFSFSNSGGSVIVRDDAGTAVVNEAFGSGADMSFTRLNQLTPGSEFVGHTTVRAGVLFSPGTCPDGSAFADGCPAGGGDDPVTDDADAGEDLPPDPCADAPMASADTLILNEILTDPPADLPGDANGDGVRDAADDEFVELWNASGALLRVEGVEIRNNDAAKKTLTGCLEANTGIVAFGGLETNATPPTYADMIVITSGSTFGFSNSGGTVSVVAPGGTVIASYAYGAGNDVSFVRNPELSNSSPWVESTTPAFTPGTCNNGASLATGCN